MTDLRRLYAPFSPAVVSWRIGSTNQDKTKGMALAYIDARDVMERLDEVCGPGGWQCKYSHTATKTVCDIGIKVGDEWIWKADGAGDSDIEAEKGALSDAFKRAAVKWGIGRYLYELPSPWVAIEQRGRSHFIPEQEKKRLIQLLASSWGARGVQGAVNDAHADGLTKNAPDAKKEQAAKCKARVDDALATFAMVGQSADILKSYWNANARQFEWIERHFPSEYERLSQAYDDALSAASDRAA